MQRLKGVGREPGTGQMLSEVVGVGIEMGGAKRRSENKWGYLYMPGPVRYL